MYGDPLGLSMPSPCRVTAIQSMKLFNSESRAESFLLTTKAIPAERLGTPIATSGVMKIPTTTACTWSNVYSSEQKTYETK